MELLKRAYGLRATGYGAIAVVGAGCASVVEDRTPYLDEARVLAVRSSPAEVEAGEAFTLDALYAGAEGALDDAEVDWSFCTARKPLAEPGPVASACLEPSSESLAPLGTGLSVAGTLPDDVCSLFGPNPPPPDESGTAGRPVDPDTSGGYHQPVLGFDASGAATLASVRARCGLANVSQDAYVAWNLAYHDNTNPEIAALTVDGALLADGTVVSAGTELTVEVGWPECPATASCGDAVCSGDETAESCAEDCEAPVGCTGAETYALWDGEEETLATIRETISVSWYVTGGSLDTPRGGRASDDVGTTVTTGWAVPDAGEAWLGVVVRDDRGGVGFAGYTLTVE